MAGGSNNTHIWSIQFIRGEEVAVAEWTEALQEREKINQKQRDPKCSALSLAILFLKNSVYDQMIFFHQVVS